MMKKPFRNRQLAKIHIAIGNSGIGKEDFRDLFEQITGKRQCRNMTPTDLAKLIWHFEQKGYLDKPKEKKSLAPQSSAKDKPTQRISDKQWRYICWLKRKLRLDDTHFRNYLRQVCKIEHERFLTAKTAKDLITGLRQWEKANGKKILETTGKDGNRENHGTGKDG